MLVHIVLYLIFLPEIQTRKALGVLLVPSLSRVLQASVCSCLGLSLFHSLHCWVDHSGETSNPEQKPCSPVKCLFTLSEGEGYVLRWYLQDSLPVVPHWPPSHSFWERFCLQECLRTFQGDGPSDPVHQWSQRSEWCWLHHGYLQFGHISMILL